MQRNVKIGLVGAAAVALAGCASTRFNSTWKAPDAQPLNFAGQKVAALIISPNEATRLGAANEMKKQGLIRSK